MIRRTSRTKPVPSLWAIGLLLASCAFSAGSVALLIGEALGV